MKPKCNKAARDGFALVIHKHADTVTFDLLRDMAKALGLRLKVEIIEEGE